MDTNKNKQKGDYPMRPLNFNKRTVSLQGLKEMFIADMENGSRNLLRHLLNSFMELERDEFIQMQITNINPDFKDYRNGYYERTLRSCLGLIERIRVPRTRSGMFYPKVIEKGKQISKTTAQGLAKMYLKGVSTHNIGEVLEAILGYKVSAGHVCKITKAIDRDVQAFYKRRLQDDVKMLFLDGIYLKSKGLTKSRKKPVLVAYGIHKNGQRQFLHFRLAKSESANEWQKMINELYYKGLTGSNLELIWTDGCQGLINALEMVYPYVKRQRCWAHKMRNVANKCTKKQLDECTGDARKIYYAENKKDAINKFKIFKANWINKNQRAVDCIEKDLEELLNFYDFDKLLWKKIRTTNVIERAFLEVRRRTKVMGCFPNDDSCKRMIYSLFAYFNMKWQKRRSYIKLELKKVA